MDAEGEAPLRGIADAIASYRAEWADRVRETIERDVRKMEAEGFDPARGRGRGPWWADGGDA